MATSDRERMKTLLVEAISTLCRNGLQYDEELTVEGLIGVTLDKRDVFLISVKETFSLAPERRRKRSNSALTEIDEVHVNQKRKGSEHREASDFAESSESRDSVLHHDDRENNTAHWKGRQHAQGKSEIGGHTTRKKKKISNDDCVVIDPDLSVKAEKYEDRNSQSLCRDDDDDDSESETVLSQGNVASTQRQESHQQSEDPRGLHPSGVDPEELSVLFPIEIKQEAVADTDSSLFTSPPEVIRLPQSMNKNLSQTPVPVKMLSSSPHSTPGSSCDSQPFTSMPHFAGVDWGPHTPHGFSSTDVLPTSQQPSTSDGTTLKKTQVEAHVVHHETEAGVRFGCSMCPDYLCEKKQSVTKHIANKHSGIGFFCKYCGRRYTAGDSLYAHYRKYHKPSQPDSQVMSWSLPEGPQGGSTESSDIATKTGMPP